MMKRTLTTFMLSFFALTAFSQSKTINISVKDTTISYEVVRGEAGSTEKMAHPVDVKINKKDESTILTFSYGPAYAKIDGKRDELNAKEKTYDTYNGSEVKIELTSSGQFQRIIDAENTRDKLEEGTRQLYKKTGASDAQIEVYIQKTREMFESTENMILSMYPEVAYYIQHLGTDFTSNPRKEKTLLPLLDGTIEGVKKTKYMISDSSVSIIETAKVKNEKELLDKLFKHLTETDIAAGKTPPSDDEKPKRGKIEHTFNYVFNKKTFILMSFEQEKKFLIDGHKQVSSLSMMILKK